MEYLAYLKYLGINPVKAIRQLPGAAISDDALNHLFEHEPRISPAAKPAANKQTAGLHNDDQPLVASNGASQSLPRAEELLPSSAPSDLISTFTEHVELDNSSHNAAGSFNKHAAEQIEISDFIVWVYKHETLDLLVLAETPLHDRENIKLSIHLLQNILKALSPERSDSHGWTRDRFQWPLNVGLDQSIASASEVFQGYLQNIGRPQAMIVFADKYLHTLLELPVCGTEHVQPHYLSVVWPECNVLLSVPLSRYVQQPSLKKPLWLAIKDRYKSSV